MQVPVNMNRAWNWMTNTQVGQQIFVQKVVTIVAVVRAAVKEHPTLPPLSQAQLEKMALLQYGGWVIYQNQAGYQFFSPQLVGGTWQWALNTKGVSKKGQAYVNTVYTPPPKSPFPTSLTCDLEN
jgi:hypothetical protein